MHPAIEAMYRILKEVQDAIAAAQHQCEHPDDTLWKMYTGDSGNYDPSSDWYGADFKCGQCGKFWTVRYVEGKDNYDYRFKGTKVDSFPTP